MGPLTTGWSSHAITDAGRVRGHNEDAVLELGAEHLWCVADGMGGHHDGAHASALMVRALTGYRHSPHRGIALARLEALVARCNEMLLRHARDRDVDIIGCTLAVLTLHGASALVSWCGDARVYRLRSGRLLALTRDHSVGAESEDRDLHRQPDLQRDDRAALTAAVGGGQTLRLEHAWFALEPTDRFVLCTDGLVKELDDEDITSLLEEADSTKSIVGSLFGLYQRRGARDNIGLIGVTSTHDSRHHEFH